MSSCDRRTLLTLIAALPLAACGFEPAYGTKGPARALLGQVSIDAPADKNEFDLVQRLEERLGRTKAGAYTLGFRVETDIAGLGITPDSTVTRYNVNGRVSFTLKRADDSVATAGTVSAFTSYAASGTTVSTVSAREDAFRRLMILLADQVVTRLIATSGQFAQ
jgi:LPS-assembly lipoprotein